MNLGVERRTPGKKEDIQRGELNNLTQRGDKADRDGGRKSRNGRKN